jgi:hypothetical protein
MLKNNLQLTNQQNYKQTKYIKREKHPKNSEAMFSKQHIEAK